MCRISRYLLLNNFLQNTTKHQSNGGDFYSKKIKSTSIKYKMSYSVFNFSCCENCSGTQSSFLLSEYSLSIESIPNRLNNNFKYSSLSFVHII